MEFSVQHSDTFLQNSGWFSVTLISSYQHTSKIEYKCNRSWQLYSKSSSKYVLGVFLLFTYCCGHRKLTAALSFGNRPQKDIVSTRVEVNIIKAYSSKKNIMSWTLHYLHDVIDSMQEFWIWNPTYIYPLLCWRKN